MQLAHLSVNTHDQETAYGYTIDDMYQMLQDKGFHLPIKSHKPSLLSLDDVSECVSIQFMVYNLTRVYHESI